MTTRITILAASLIALLAWNPPEAAAQGSFMKAGPSGEQKSIAAPPSKDGTAKAKKPKSTTRCLPPGGKTPVAC